MSNSPAATTSGLSTLEAPLVLIDPCAGFVAASDEPEICMACGWLAEDHATDAVSLQAA